MNKKENAEIKKQFTPDRCSITRICGCYVDGEKNKKTELKEAFGFLIQRKFHVDEVFSDGAGEGFSEDVEVFEGFFL